MKLKMNATTPTQRDNGPSCIDHPTSSLFRLGMSSLLKGT